MFPMLLPEFSCPVCGLVMNATANLTNVRPPRAGDLSVCDGCYAIGVFQHDGSLRTATSEECLQVPEWMRQHIAQTCPPGKPS